MIFTISIFILKKPYFLSIPNDRVEWVFLELDSTCIIQRIYTPVHAVIRLERNEDSSHFFFYNNPCLLSWFSLMLSCQKLIWLELLDVENTENSLTKRNHKQLWRILDNMDIEKQRTLSFCLHGEVILQFVTNWICPSSQKSFLTVTKCS